MKVDLWDCWCMFQPWYNNNSHLLNYKTNTPYSHLDYYAEHIPMSKNTHTQTHRQTQTHRETNIHTKRHTLKLTSRATHMDTCRHRLLEFWVFVFLGKVYHQTLYYFSLKAEFSQYQYANSRKQRNFLHKFFFRPFYRVLSYKKACNIICLSSWTHPQFKLSIRINWNGIFQSLA